MNYKLEELIDINHFQSLQDKLNKIYSFPSAIIDNDGNILTATAWQDICTKFHRVNPECRKECIKSDQYIIEHLSEANPAVTYKCPHGLVDNATPIIINGVHYGNFFTGQFFLEEPDLEFFKSQAVKYGFDENEYLDAVRKVPVWDKEQLNSYLFFIKGLIEVISTVGLKNLKEIETRKKLEQSEKYLNESQVIGSMGSWEYDIINNKVFWSENCYRLYGFEINEVEPSFELFKQMVHADDLYIVNNDFQILNAGSKSIISEIKIITKDGTLKWIQNNIKPEFENDVLVRLKGLQIDITERKQSIETLQSLLQFNRQIIENMRDGVIVYGPDLRYQLWNSAMEKITGISSKDIIGKHPEELFPFLKENGVIDILKECLTDGITKATDFPFYLSVKKKSGWVTDTSSPLKDVNGNIIGVISTVRDITERKESEEALRKSENRYRVLFETVPTGITLADMNGQIIDTNPTAIKILGLSEEEQEQRKIDGTEWQILRPDGTIMPSEEYASVRALNEQRLIQNVEMGVVRAKDDIAWISVNAAPVPDVGVAITYMENTERKKAEEALRESEEKFRIISSNTPDHIVVQDLNLCYQFVVNPQLGLTEKDMIGKTDYDILSKEDADTLTVIKSEVLKTGESLHADFSLKSLDGSTQYFDGSYIPKFDSAGQINGVIGYLRNVTDRKLSEAALKESEEKFSKIFASAPVLMSLTDIETGRFTEVNEESIKVSGFSREEIIGKTPTEIGWIKGDDRANLLNLLNEKGRVDGLELKLYSKDGHAVECLYHGEIIQLRGKPHLLSISLEISQRKQAEELLHQKTALLEAQLNSTIDGILVVDNNGKKVLQNQRIVELWKIPAEIADNPDDQLQVKHVMNFTKHPDQFLEQVNYLYSHPDETSNDEIELKDGTILDRYSAPVIGNDGINYGRIWLFRDITERKQSEEELEKHRNHLEELVETRTKEIDVINRELKKEIEMKNEAQHLLSESLEKEKELSDLKSRFISTASHEFRTPLTSILMSAGLIQRYYNKWDSTKIDEHLERVIHSVKNLTKLIDNVITINRADAGKIILNPVKIDLKELCDRIIEEINFTTSNQLKILLKFNCKETCHSLDAKQIEIILQNLLSNAVKYSPNGGVVILEVNLKGKKLLFSVIDEGIGIPEEDLPRLFEPFHRGKNSDEFYGSGLGLSIVKSAVKLHGGSIKVNSVLEKGTVFTVEIPIKVEPKN